MEASSGWLRVGDEGGIGCGFIIMSEVVRGFVMFCLARYRSP